MPEFSDYVETRIPVTDPQNILWPVSKDGDAASVSYNQMNSFRGTWGGTNAFPTTGGRGPSGSPGEGDQWLLTAELTVGGTVYSPGTIIMALINTPGQTLSNWAKFGMQL
jgi:hypothetical protein